MCKAPIHGYLTDSEARRIFAQMLHQRVAVFRATSVIPLRWRPPLHRLSFTFTMCCIVTLELSDSANARFIDHMTENGWERDREGAWRNDRFFAGRRFSEPEARSAELKRFFGPGVIVGIL
jgi:hypothetical protein